MVTLQTCLSVLYQLCCISHKGNSSSESNTNTLTAVAHLESFTLKHTKLLLTKSSFTCLTHAFLSTLFILSGKCNRPLLSVSQCLTSSICRPFLFHVCRVWWDHSCGIWSSTWLSLPRLCEDRDPHSHVEKRVGFLCVCVCVHGHVYVYAVMGLCHFPQKENTWEHYHCLPLPFSPSFSLSATALLPILYRPLPSLLLLLKGTGTK